MSSSTSGRVRPWVRRMASMRRSPDHQHVQPAGLVLFSEDGANLVLRGVAGGDDLPGDHQHRRRPFRGARGADGLSESPGAAVARPHHELAVGAPRQAELRLKRLRDEADVHPLVGVQPGHGGDHQLRDALACPAVHRLAEKRVERRQGSVRRGGEEVHQSNRRGEPKLALPVLCAGPSVLGVVGVAKKEPAQLLARGLGGRLGEPFRRASFGGRKRGFALYSPAMT